MKLMRMTGSAAGTFCLAMVLVGGLCTLAGAAEVVTQNDNLNNFQSAVVLGDFVAGEQAGARLQSPCDGNIVAVQILWWEGAPGHQASLEESIWIYDDGVFPNPGPVLLELEGPLMTPQFLNEFRYVDENNTIPISVPVTAGQHFYVTLEFANPTDVMLPEGGPSIVRDVTGCQANSNVLYGNFGLGTAWWDFCLLIEGDLVFRAVVDCTEEAGACCDGEANCLNDIEQGDCQAEGDTFFVGQDCFEVSCPEPTGACCNGSGGCLDGQTQAFCEGLPTGIYGGNGTTCADQVCALGACCMPLGNCENLVDVACGDAGGLFEGPGTSCASTSCPQPLGACCLGTTCVNSQTQLNCESFPGVWQGAFTSCSPSNPCLLCNDGDADEDGDVDLYDFAILHRCFGGSSAGICECLDMDNDTDVDNDDVVSFTNALTGP